MHGRESGEGRRPHEKNNSVGEDGSRSGDAIGFRIWGLGFRVQALNSGVLGAGCFVFRVSGFGFRFRVEGSGFRGFTV